MKRTLALLSILFIAATASAQTEIKVEDAANHVGENVKVCTLIYGAKYFDNSGITLLNAGAKFPNSPLTVMIPKENHADFKNKPEDYYPEKSVCVTGKIVLYKGRPEIIVTSEKDIVVQ